VNCTQEQAMKARGG